MVLPPELLMLKSRGMRRKHDLKPVAYEMEILAMLMKIERRCDFGVCLPCRVTNSCSDNFVNFGCLVQTSRLFEPAQASSPHLIVT
jgi:hypothetical protein